MLGNSRPERTARPPVAYGKQRYQQGQQDEQDLKLGLTSRIALLQRKRRNLTREQAVELYGRLVVENAAYPGPQTGAAPPERGTVGAQVDAVLKVNDAVKAGLDRAIGVAMLRDLFGFEQAQADALVVAQGPGRRLGRRPRRSARDATEALDDLEVTFVEHSNLARRDRKYQHLAHYGAQVNHLARIMIGVDYRDSAFDGAVAVDLGSWPD